MVAIQAGEFIMGSPEGEVGRDTDEGPQRLVVVSPLAVSKFEITFDLWAACVHQGGCGGHLPSDEGFGHGDLPVINVSWYDAREYVRWLSQQTRQGYRLLTEAEWEYAARAGTVTPFWLGASVRMTQARFNSRSSAFVGSYAANAFGLHDVHGNVSEWVQDCYGPYEASPSGAARGGPCAERVHRGGSWLIGFPQGLRSAYRGRTDAGIRSNGIGLRVARDF